MSFVFYDLETSGLDPRFDQILEVAAIQTDSEFNEVDRLHVRCKLRPHVIASIEALAVNGFDIDRCTDQTLPTHYETMQDVWRTFVRWSPSIFVGWNSISFDEEFLRFAFYQCLIDSYPTSRRGNGRLDLMRIAGAVFRFAPQCLKPAYTEDGIKTLRLEALAKANGIKEHRAHDAMSDTEAMIELAALIRHNAGPVWSQTLRFSKKANATALLEQGQPFVITEVFQGRSDQYAVAPLGRDESDESKTRWIAADIGRDFDTVESMSDAELSEWLTTSPRPLRSIKVNASPIIIPLDELDEFGGVDVEDLADKAEAIMNDRRRSKRMVQIFSAATQKTYSNEEVEQQLYDGFCDDAEWEIINQFHAVPWPKRMEIIRRIPDRRYRQLGRRLIFEHAPESLSSKQAIQASRWLKTRLNDPQEVGLWRSKPMALAEAQQFQSIENNGDISRLVNSYCDYVSMLP